MQVGDQCLFYHSSCKQIGVVGLATVCRAHYADPADKAWAVVDVEYRDTYRQIVSLDALKQHRDGGWGSGRHGSLQDVPPLGPASLAAAL